MADSGWRLLADAVLLVHGLFVLFVVLGLALIAIGGFAGWAWVRNFWFRLAHLCAIGIVVAQAWLGVLCPLTKLEIWLRQQAGEASYEGSFVQHWVERLLYYDAPAWVFVVVYTGFAALVVGVWIFVPPRRGRV